MCAIMKTFGKPFEKYLQELWFFFWILVCLEVSYNKGIENGNWMIYLQSLVVFVYIAIYSIGNNDDNGLSSYVKPELITPDKFSMRGNIKTISVRKNMECILRRQCIVGKVSGGSFLGDGEIFSWYM